MLASFVFEGLGQIRKPKGAGGLGFRKKKEVNRAFLAKLDWQFEIAQHKPWAQLIRAKVFKGQISIGYGK